MITPVKNGGIPFYAELKLVFKEGGAFEFYNTYTSLLDRLHAQDGTEVVEHLEDLPMYSGRPGQVPNREESASTSVQEEMAAPEDIPDDLPPAYDEVASDEGTRGRSRVRH